MLNAGICNSKRTMIIFHQGSTLILLRHETNLWKFRNKRKFLAWPVLNGKFTTSSKGQSPDLRSRKATYIGSIVGLVGKKNKVGLGRPVPDETLNKLTDSVPTRLIEGIGNLPSIKWKSQWNLENLESKFHFLRISKEENIISCFPFRVNWNLCHVKYNVKIHRELLGNVWK